MQNPQEDPPGPPPPPAGAAAGPPATPFGSPLAQSVLPGLDIPLVVRDSIKWLMTYAVPSRADLFSGKGDAATVERLRAVYERMPGPLKTTPIDESRADPLTVAQLLTLFLGMMPHPVIPPKYYYNFAKIYEIDVPRRKFVQLRVMVHKLPPLSKNLLFALCTFLNSTHLDISSVAQIFSHTILSPPPSSPSVPHASSITAALIQQIHFIEKAVSEPMIDEATAAQMPERVFGQPEYVLEGTSLYDFPGGPWLLALKKGETVHLLDVKEEDGWLQAISPDTGTVGYVPENYVDIVAVAAPKSAGAAAVAAAASRKHEKKHGTMKREKPPPPQQKLPAAASPDPSAATPPPPPEEEKEQRHEEKKPKAARPSSLVEPIKPSMPQRTASISITPDMRRPLVPSLQSPTSSPPPALRPPQALNSPPLQSPKESPRFKQVRTPSMGKTQIEACKHGFLSKNRERHELPPGDEPPPPPPEEDEPPPPPPDEDEPPPPPPPPGDEPPPPPPDDLPPPPEDDEEPPPPPPMDDYYDSPPPMPSRNVGARSSGGPARPARPGAGVDIPPPPPPGFAVSTETNESSEWRKNLESDEAAVVDKLMRKRKAVANEVLETEDSYIKQLTIIFEVFMKPIKSSDMGLATSDIYNLFSNVEVIKTCHERLRENLYARVVSWTDNSLLGDIFLKNTAWIKLYKYYVNNYGNSLHTLKQCKEKSATFRNFVAKLDYSEQLSGLSFESFLVVPVQRIPRYVLLLTDMLRSTPVAHPDNKPLTEALAFIKELADNINERKHDSDNQETLLSIQEKLSGYPGDLTTMTKRVFVKDGPITANKEKSRLWIFSDIAILTKADAKKGKYTFKQVIDLKTTAVQKEDPLTWKLLSTEGAIRLQAEEADQLLRPLEETLERARDSLIKSAFVDDLGSEGSKQFQEIQEAENEKRREAVMHQLVNTEKEYVEYLEFTWNTFLSPIAKSADSANPMVNATKAQSIVANFDQILLEHKKLLGDLQLREKEWASDQKKTVTDIFDERALFLRSYSHYVSNHAEQIAVLDQALLQSQLLAFWLRDVESAKKVDLRALLERPLRRVSEYYLLLAEMLQMTNKKHCDYEPLNKVASQLRSIKDDLSKKSSESKHASVLGGGILRKAPSVSSNGRGTLKKR